MYVLDMYRDDPEQWLRTVESSPVEMLMLLFPLLWQQGVGMELLRKGEQPAYFLFILQERDHTINFFSFLAGNPVCNTAKLKCEIQYHIAERHLYVHFKHQCIGTSYLSYINTVAYRFYVKIFYKLRN